MGRLTIDTTQAMSFEAVSPGPYLMLVDEISDPEQGEKSIYVNVAFKFQDPNVDRVAGKVFRNYPITGKGAGFFREFWKACTGEDIPLNANVDVNTDDALNRPVLVQIGNEEYEGRLQNRVEKVTAAA